MSNHLSQEQFAKCFVAGSTSASKDERQHLAECPKCQAELDSFGNTVSSLRLAIRGRVDERVAAQPGDITPISVRPAVDRMPTMGWALATAAVLLLGLVPFLTQKPREAIEEVTVETNADALMNAINLHLSRTVPSPMEPMMSLIPSDGSITESGGVQ